MYNCRHSVYCLRRGCDMTLQDSEKHLAASDSTFIYIKESVGFR
jgi:hypothetical protein